MQPPKTREVTRRLEKEGWKLVREKGGRRRYRKDGKHVTIHGKDSDALTKGTWGAIKRQANW
jgi:predicted RNA binding protein YcfA (HicA-like mRNA interferase family)